MKIVKKIQNGDSHCRRGWVIHEEYLAASVAILVDYVIVQPWNRFVHLLLSEDHHLASIYFCVHEDWSWPGPLPEGTPQPQRVSFFGYKDPVWQMSGGRSHSCPIKQETETELRRCQRRFLLKEGSLGQKVLYWLTWTILTELNCMNWIERSFDLWGTEGEFFISLCFS